MHRVILLSLFLQSCVVDVDRDISPECATRCAQQCEILWQTGCLERCYAGCPPAK
jgi:hypothetical protein